MRSCLSRLILSIIVLTKKKLLLTKAIHFKEKGGESNGRCQLEMLFEQQVFRIRIERSVKQISLRINMKILASNTSNITHEKNETTTTASAILLFFCMFFSSFILFLGVLIGKGESFLF